MTMLGRPGVHIRNEFYYNGPHEKKNDTSRRLLFITITEEQFHVQAAFYTTSTNNFRD